jgi:hypothetical protein
MRDKPELSGWVLAGFFAGNIQESRDMASL